jgi:hypothetical protein
MALLQRYKFYPKKGHDIFFCKLDLFQKINLIKIYHVQTER